MNAVRDILARKGMPIPLDNKNDLLKLLGELREELQVGYTLPMDARQKIGSFLCKVGCGRPYADQEFKIAVELLFYLGPEVVAESVDSLLCDSSQSKRDFVTYSTCSYTEKLHLPLQLAMVIYGARHFDAGKRVKMLRQLLAMLKHECGIPPSEDDRDFIYDKIQWAASMGDSKAADDVVSLIYDYMWPNHTLVNL